MYCHPALKYWYMILVHVTQPYPCSSHKHRFTITHTILHLHVEHTYPLCYVKLEMSQGHKKAWKQSLYDFRINFFLFAGLYVSTQWMQCLHWCMLTYKRASGRKVAWHDLTACSVLTVERHSWPNLSHKGTLFSNKHWLIVLLRGRRDHL